MDYERYSEWVARSFRWIRAEKDKGLPHHIQLLGLADAELRGIRFKDLFDDDGHEREDQHGILVLERFQIRAHLWLLGAYELVRMIHQRLREDPTLATDESITAVEETRKAFERVRIPLAKLEAAKRHKDTDFEVAHPGIGARGLGWEIAPKRFVFQEDLSDLLYEMLCKMRPRA